MRETAEGLRSAKGEFMAAFGAFNHVTLDKRGTARASKGSTVGNIKFEAAFGATHYYFSLRTQRWNHHATTSKKTIKTFPIHQFKNNLNNLRVYAKLCFIRCDG